MSVTTAHACKGKTLADRIRFLGRTHPDTPAFIFWSPTGRSVLSRGDVLDLSSRFACRLTQHGVKPRDVVCIALPNIQERVVVEYGIQLAGAVSMNGQVLRADGEDIIGALNKAKCSCIVLDPENKSGAWQICKTAFGRCKMFENHAEIESLQVPSLKKAFMIRQAGQKNAFLETLHEDQKMTYETSDPQDTCTIFTTSGSTGYSKLVPQTNEMLLTCPHLFNERLDLQASTKYFNSSPFGWIGGYPFFYLSFGCTRIAIDESYGEIPDKSAFIWDVLCREKVEIALLTPLNLQAVSEKKRATLKHGQSHVLSRVITGGQPITKETIAVLGELTDLITIMYGGTEFALGSVIDIDMSKSSTFENHMAGYPPFGIQLKVVDKELKMVPTLSKGEILIKSPYLTSGYIGAETSSNENFLPNGWFRTGDIGFLREDGCLFVEGRSSDAIMHGAYILYPTWLEQILVKCPGVKDVVIVPVPDKVLHHEICACVQLDDTSDVHPSSKDIISFSQKEIVLNTSSNLSVIPKHVIFFTKFPLTKSNKLDRKTLAELARAQLGL